MPTTFSTGPWRQRRTSGQGRNSRCATPPKSSLRGPSEWGYAMSSKYYIKPIGKVWMTLLAVLLWLPSVLPGSEMFIYRRFDPRENLLEQKKIVVHGELFGQLLAPSTFPSYNDLSGDTDRWNYGFHNYLLIAPGTILHAQLITHADNGTRTKF